MIKIDKHTRKELIDLFEKRKICIEGNILKLIDSDGDKEFQDYIDKAIEKDKKSRKKRLDVTKKVQKQNTELTRGQKENNRVNRQLTKALEEAEDHEKQAMKAMEDAIAARDEAEQSRIEAEKARLEAENAKAVAENAKTAAENDLAFLQKKKQFELIGTIVKVALWVILGVGVTTTVMYIAALWAGQDTTVIGSTWSNIIGILLTNAFSIVGTIMGVKYASGKKSEEE